MTAADLADTVREAFTRVENGTIFVGEDPDVCGATAALDALVAQAEQVADLKTGMIAAARTAKAAEADRDRLADALHAIAEMERWVQAGPLIDIARTALAHTDRNPV